MPRDWSIGNSFNLRRAPISRSKIPWLLMLCLPAAAATTDTKTNGVNFVKEVAPILAAKCVACHQPSKTKGGYQLHTFGAFMTAGRSKESPVVAGDPKKSHL